MNPKRHNRSSGPRRRPAKDRGAPKGPPPRPLEPSADPPEIESFDHWSLHPDVQAAIADMGIRRPTPIQALAIGPILQRRDVIAQAETGTGKTLAFGAPMISLVDAERVSVQALILCPTRELAEQVAGVLEELGDRRGIGVALIVGGEPAGPQVAALQSGAQVVVGTPGRVLDLLGQGFLSFPWTEFVVLDEADEMLEIGFLDDVREILSRTDPELRTTLLFSATFPPELLKLAREHTRDPVEVATASGVATVDTIEQTWFEIAEDDRPLALIRLFENSAPDDVFLVFCERRTEVDRLMRRLERTRFQIKALHGGYDQEARFRVMTAFREGLVKALVATDVASRGLDVAHVTHVVNYSVPRDVTAYTHRIGRTGRAGREGAAITLVPPRQRARWKSILRAVNWPIREVEAPGRAPRRERESGSSARGAARPAGGRRSDAQGERQDSRRRSAGGARRDRATSGSTRTGIDERATSEGSAPSRPAEPRPEPAPPPPRRNERALPTNGDGIDFGAGVD